MNTSNDQVKKSFLFHFIAFVVLSGICIQQAQAQDKYTQYEGMYGGYGAKVVLMLNDELRVYMIVTQGKQLIQNNYFEYKSILSSRGAVEINNHKYAYSRDRYEGSFMMKEGKAIAVNHNGDEKKKLVSLVDLLRHMEVDAKELLQYMTANHGMSAERVKELVLAPKLTTYLGQVDLAKFNLVDLLLEADKL